MGVYVNSRDGDAYTLKVSKWIIIVYVYLSWR